LSIINITDAAILAFVAKVGAKNSIALGVQTPRKVRSISLKKADPLPKLFSKYFNLESSGFEIQVYKTQKSIDLFIKLFTFHN